MSEKASTKVEAFSFTRSHAGVREHGGGWRGTSMTIATRRNVPETDARYFLNLRSVLYNDERRSHERELFFFSFKSSRYL